MSEKQEYKLIKSGKLVLHRYTAKDQHWGHSMQGFKANDRDVEYEDLTTYSVSGTCFSQVPLRVGDFISRNMESGKVGAFEIQICGRLRDEKGEGNWPPDIYFFEANFCGYLIEEGSGTVLSVFSGYGIRKPNPLFRFLDIFGKRD